MEDTSVEDRKRCEVTVKGKVDQVSKQGGKERKEYDHDEPGP